MMGAGFELGQANSPLHCLLKLENVVGINMTNALEQNK